MRRKLFLPLCLLTTLACEGHYLLGELQPSQAGSAGAAGSSGGSTVGHAGSGGSSSDPMGEVAGSSSNPGGSGGPSVEFDPLAICTDPPVFEAITPSPVIHLGAYRTNFLAVTGDWDQDGKLDLATASWGIVSVLSGKGDGTFELASDNAPADYTVSAELTDLAAADVDGDGVTDLVLAHRAPGGVTVLLGHGDGTFANGIETPVDKYLIALAVGDFDHDGRDDVAVTGAANITVESSSVSIFLGRSEGHLVLAGEYPGGREIVSGDLDEDGSLDLVMTADMGTVLLGDGAGKFRVGVGYGSWADDISLADLNNDGHLDLLTAINCSKNDGIYSRRLGKGDGAFEPPVQISKSCGTPTVVDINGDGKLDVVGGDLGVLLGNGDGTVTQGPSSFVGLTGDWTGDGKLDTLSFGPDGLNASGSPHHSPTFVRAGLGDGTFEPVIRRTFGEYNGWLRLADVNGDAALDLVGVGAGVSVAFGHDDGTFAAPRSYTTLNPYNELEQYSRLAIGDLNGDGSPDLVVDGASLAVLLGDGNGAYGSPIVLDNMNSYYAPPVLTDLNEDSRLDLIAAEWQGDLRVGLGRGDGTFLSGPDNQPQVRASSLAIGELNGDDELDLVLAGSDSAFVLFGAGDGTFSRRLAPFLDSSARIDSSFAAVALGDLDADGRLDLVIRSLAGTAEVQSLIVMLGKGDGTFVLKARYQAKAVEDAVIEDVDGDGKLDVVTSDVVAITVYRGQGDGTLRCAESYSHTGGMALGDLNHDGKLDIAAVGWRKVDVLFNQRP